MIVRAVQQRTMAGQTDTLQNTEVLGDVQVTGPWVVILYNDDYHDFDEVILQVQRATGCSLEEAVCVTATAHLEGRAVAHHGSQDECERAANVLRQIRLQAETDRSF